MCLSEMSEVHTFRAGTRSPRSDPRLRACTDHWGSPSEMSEVHISSDRHPLAPLGGACGATQVCAKSAGACGAAQVCAKSTGADAVR